MLAELERTAGLVERDRIVSRHDPDARPIATGRLGKPVEFGYEAQVVDNADGIVLDRELHRGAPPDAPMLVPAIARVKARFGCAARAVTADRGYGEASVDTGLEDLGVRRVVIAAMAAPASPAKPCSEAGFRKLVKHDYTSQRDHREADTTENSPTAGLHPAPHPFFRSK